MDLAQSPDVVSTEYGLKMELIHSRELLLQFCEVRGAEWGRFRSVGAVALHTQCLRAAKDPVFASQSTLGQPFLSPGSGDQTPFS